MTKRKIIRSTPASVSLARHQRACTICKHPQRSEIEDAYIAWRSTIKIASDFGLPDRTSVWRHAVALGLVEKRGRNLHSALGAIIERGGEVEVTAAAVVSAVQAYAKINAAGQWVDRNETISLNDLFARMTPDEMERYAVSGELPAWFRVGATQRT